MKTLHLIGGALLLLVLAGPAVAGPDCMLPPADAMSPAAASGGSFDTKYVGKWSGDQATIDALWAGLNCEQGDWEDGWGFEAAWDLNLPLSRLLNAAWIVRSVQTYTKHHGKWHTVSDIPDDAYQKGHWWDFVDQYGEDEWEPTCDDGPSVASHNYVPLDWFYYLEIPGAYRYPAPNRASTLVHETTHEDVDHIDKDACTPPSASCDTGYGQYNANTMQINYLIDAATTFKTKPGTDGVAHVVTKNGDTCALVPFFSEVERELMQARGEAVGKRFQGSVFMPFWEIDDAMDDSVWQCKSCNTAEWTFNPNTCQQKACNEILNPVNGDINGINKGACAAYNQAVAVSDSADDVAAAKAAQVAGTKACAPATPAAAFAYCTAQIGKASVAKDIDACGWLQTTPGPAVGKLECVELFCQQKYLESGGQGWESDDSFGCLDLLCEDGGCGDSGTKEECVFGYNLVQGDPTAFVPSCGVDGCHGKLVHCVYEAYLAGTWAKGDPYPDQCKLAEDLCVLASKLASIVAVNMVPQIDPGPLHEVLDNPAVSTPAKGLFGYMAQLAAGSLTGGNLDQLAIGMTAAPERAALLYNLAPAKMTWLYGAETFGAVAGPSAAWVKPEAIVPGDLNAAGQAALDQLQGLVDKSADGVVPSALGAISLK